MPIVHSMETCTACGAELTPGLDWCGRCLAPRNTAHPAYRGPGAATVHPLDPRVRPKAEPVPVEYSRMRGGPTSMGVLGRSLTTVGVFVLAYLVYVSVFAVGLGFGGLKVLAVYGVLAVPVIAVVLRRVWRPARIR
jgi:hypothetical protein